MSLEKIDWKVLCIAIIVLGAIECVALTQGINGKLMSTVIGAICLLAGVMIPNPFKKEMNP